MAHRRIGILQKARILHRRREKEIKKGIKAKDPSVASKHFRKAKSLLERATKLHLKSKRTHVTVTRPPRRR